MLHSETQDVIMIIHTQLTHLVLLNTVKRVQSINSFCLPHICIISINIFFILFDCELICGGFDVNDRF